MDDHVEQESEQQKEATEPAAQDRVHYLTVEKAGSGCLVPYLRHVVRLPPDRGAPMVVAIPVRGQTVSGVLLCSDAAVGCQAGFEFALMNPGKALQMVAASYEGEPEGYIDTFVALTHIDQALVIARYWSERAATLDNVEDMVIESGLLISDLKRWIIERLSELSGQDPFQPPGLPDSLKDKSRRLWLIGREFAQRFRLHQVRSRARGDEPAQATKDSFRREGRLEHEREGPIHATAETALGVPSGAIEGKDSAEADSDVQLHTFFTRRGRTYSEDQRKHFATVVLSNPELNERELEKKTSIRRSTFGAWVEFKRARAVQVQGQGHSVRGGFVESIDGDTHVVAVDSVN